MRRLRIAKWAGALVLLCFAQMSLAQTVAVRSGEHPQFSRLVLDTGRERTWELSEDGDQRWITFDPPIEAFDLSSVFDLIPQTRLRDIAAREGLVLTLACDCPITSSRHQNRYLVLDISDPESTGIADSPESAGTDDGLAARRVAAAEALPDLTQLLVTPTQTPTETDPPEARRTEPLEEAARIMADPAPLPVGRMLPPAPTARP